MADWFFKLALLAATERPSLRFVVLSTVALFVLVIVMTTYLLLLRTWYKLRASYRASRATLYAPAIEMVLMEEPFERIKEKLRPRRIGDADIIQEIVTDSMRYLSGPPFDTLRRAGVELGFVNRNLRALKSWDRHRRGRAMEMLGLLGARQSIPHIAKRLNKENLDIQLVALRTLAAIGDPAALPLFLQVTDRLPPGLLPRVASMMLEFGPPGREAVTELINRRHSSFRPAVIRDLLEQLSTDWEQKP